MIILKESRGLSQVDSRFATNTAGATGLMGVVAGGGGPGERPTVQALLDPGTNISWGTAILRKSIQVNQGDLFKATANYNTIDEYLGLQGNGYDYAAQVFFRMGWAHRIPDFYFNHHFGPLDYWMAQPIAAQLILHHDLATLEQLSRHFSPRQWPG